MHMTRPDLSFTVLSFTADDGALLQADSYGDPDAAAVLMLHGGGQTRHAWDETAQQLARAGWHAIALDMRGHGCSDWSPKGDYRTRRFAQDIRNIAAQLPQAPVLIGASLGGLASLLAIGEAVDDMPTERIARALILVDIAPRLNLDGVARILDFMGAHPDGFTSLDEVADAVARYQPQRKRSNNHAGLLKNLRLKGNGRYYWHWDPAMLAHFRSHQDPAQESAHFMTAAQQLQLPTLLVTGKLSDIVNDDISQEFLQAVPHARHVDVAGAGHMVAGDKNDVFSTAIIEFMAALRAD